ncbi:MAG: mannose-1-phosphate guanylyltransferase [Firmicutes bacterium]|nr:mannose-1-phosphate guanylyltransferase [Bacillota bacterium]MCM1401032.1 mannose-1-phosphate guanylyltransferase [Bacteroides sp.]MCM1476951.1 mannose-1-phosphate guanylyltransferase [Bacteroides sp.]
MIDPHRYCVIMCGGIGSRFWPYSRSNMPKQFLDLFGTGRSLLQMSYDRILPIVKPENVLVVTNQRYLGLVKEQLPELSDSQILLEPDRRNTAPCIAWAAYHIAAIDPEASMIVTPSDHLITRETIFENCVRRGFDFIEHNDVLLTLGINPTRPETGYGYIQIGREVEPGLLKVKTFTEKPNRELAQVFIDTGEFYWNAGIFLWTVKSIKTALHRYAPDLTSVFDRGNDCFGTPRETTFIKENFAGCPSISIDFAVMEKADNVYVECVNFGWSDLGTWGSLYDNSHKDNNENVSVAANVMTYASSGNIIMAPEGKLVVVSGMHDWIVADAGDVLLICPKSDEQQIKVMLTDVQISHDNRFL